MQARITDAEMPRQFVEHRQITLTVPVAALMMLRVYILHSPVLQQLIDYPQVLGIDSAATDSTSGNSHQKHEP